MLCNNSSRQIQVIQSISTMKEPLISVCLPVLNAGKFLDDRLESIFAQTLTNWELIVVDGFSDDGSWEKVVARCADDPRIHLCQQPRCGVYAAVNRAIEQSASEYVYIATADDTMEPRCLERLLELSRSQTKPCIAQCGLTLIDEFGNALPEEQQWPANTEWHSEFGSQFSGPHVRTAPFDGAAVMLFGTLITSLTQALFPREAFLKLGAFPKQFGSAGDMAWEAVAGFFYDVCYTAEPLATWRYHEAQATRNPAAGDNNWPDRRVAMGDWILGELLAHDSALARRARVAALADFSRFWRERLRSGGTASIRKRCQMVLRMFRSCPHFYASYLLKKISGSPGDPVNQVRREILGQFIDDPEFSLSILPGRGVEG
jgi:glycosyltransferase involved in cell wall biosynthesis